MKTKFTFLLLLLVTFSAIAEVSNKEIKALLKFYNSTNGFQWKNKWDTKAPVRTWFGVKVEDNKVVSIILVNNNLTGELPKELGDLIYIREINLFRNKISGVLPATLGNLKNLEKVLHPQNRPNC